MEEKLILGLDVSTTTIGIAIFKDLGDKGELIDLNRIKPKPFEKSDIPEHDNILKAHAFNQYMVEKYAGLKFDKIIIEEPLYSSNNIYTVSSLRFFNGIVSYLMWDIFGVKPDYISSSDARHYGLPETTGIRPKNKKPTRFGCLPMKISGQKIDKKLVVLHQVGKRFPELKWFLNKNMTIADENCDMADAITCVLGHMSKIGKWTSQTYSLDNVIDA